MPSVHTDSPAKTVASKSWSGLQPIRFDFWSGESLQQVGEDLARSPSPDLPFFASFNVTSRLRDNQMQLLASQRNIQAAVREKVAITPAAEWLLDNHHIVEESFRHLQRDLPRNIYRNLPATRLVDGTSVPRALTLMWYYVAVTNSTTDQRSLTEIVEGFQAATVLTIGEIWAIPALLRFVLLENLRRLSDRVENSRNLRIRANALADRLRSASDAQVAEILTPQAEAMQDPTFWSQLMYRLRDGSNTSSEALNWLEHGLQAQQTTPEQVIAAEHALQSTGNVTVGNIIRSLRKIEEIDWFSWFEKISHVDHILRRDPDYANLDKTTRNSYREAIERISRRSASTEIEVAEAAVAGHSAGDLLVGDGRAGFERACGYRPRLNERILTQYRRLGWLGIFLPGLVFSLVLAMLMANAVAARPDSWMEIALFVAAVLPASEAATGLINRASARFVPPKILPAYDYTDGVPEDARTLVVIPCLLTSLDEIDTLVRALEVHYLANPKGAVSFALVSDWVDSPTEKRPEDYDLLAHATAVIDALSQRYAATGARRFFLLHRCRLYNAQDKVWMGWERKRGKLVELNQLLRGDSDTSFLDTGPRPARSTRYIVTLDADTRLVRDAVPALVGKIAHPVNRPVADPATGRVVRGHAILQPRLTPSLAMGEDASMFQRIFSVDRGLDPYVFTASDLYQDLLGEGTYTGKGIYDIDAFMAATDDRLPENAVLSHDLLEGSLARAALVSDVRFVEDFPVQYSVEASRQHRWARGDWQLLPFIVNPTNGLPALARLKMVDNLRRSLVAPAWVVASVLGWLMLPMFAALNWQALLLLMLFLGSLLSVNTGLQPNQTAESLLWYTGRFFSDAVDHLRAMALRLTLLAHQAALIVDAILRTFFRVFISHRNLLEWRTARQVASANKGSLLDDFLSMAASPLIGIAAIALVALFNPQNLLLASAISAFWIFAPLIAHNVSKTLETADTLVILPEDRAALRGVARVTWRFFQEFVTEASNHLPPDNYQDNPAPKIAERTSPTNIGLYLLSVVSARDFGWISLNEAVNRIERTLGTIGRLELHQGHLFNWYDTSTLAVLEPRYVSTVDSGNLAGHLIAVASTLKDWASAPMVHLLTDPQGALDTLRILRRSIDAIPDDRRILRPLRRRLEERIEGFARTHNTYIAEPQLAPVRALGLSVVADDIRQLAKAYAAEIGTDVANEMLWWSDALKANCEALLSGPVNRADEAATLSQRLDHTAERTRALAFSMDFGFLVDPDSELLSIGCRPETGQLDTARYDLLASEARLASLFAIAKGDVPNRHWFRLGRPVAAFGLHGALMSWSGSMFEYLMPPLVMDERLGSILNESCQTAISEQIAYGRKLGLPWGISESAFNARDADLNYQYHAFGAPALALKRMVADERVVAPYASALAAQFQPRAALENLRRLENLGALGPHGFFDSVDFTPRRMPQNASHVVVRNVMSHHQGMTICAIANAVLKGIHRDRFHSDPVIQAAELLLQERAPQDITPISRPEGANLLRGGEADTNPISQTVVHDPATADRTVGVLSNGAFSAMLSAVGSGYVRVGDRALTRWRPDMVRNDSGIFLFLRDTETNAWWSATTAPRPAPGEEATAIFSDHKVEFTKRVLGIDSHLEVLVASEANAIGHRLTLRNHSIAERVIEVTSYGEIVLDTDAADAAHPAFSKMFVRTDIIRNGTAITASRNSRAASDTPLHLVHLACGSVEGSGNQAETDRRAFVGRGRDLGNAAAFDPGANLSGAAGFTLDPIFALRRRLRLPPGKEVYLTYWTVVTDTVEERDRAVSHYCRPETFDHESRLAWTFSQVKLRHLETTLEEAALFRQIAAFLVYPDNGLAAQDPQIRQALEPQSKLWALGISGDYPIMVLSTDTEADLPIVSKMLRLQKFLHARGVKTDLVILNERAASYVQDLQSAIGALCAAAAQASYGSTNRAHVFTLRRDQLGDTDRRALLAAARIFLHSRNGKLSEQLRRYHAARSAKDMVITGQRLLAAPSRPLQIPPTRTFPVEELLFHNGYGGFSKDGREYVIRLRHGQQTPHPWINVIGRSDFGFHVSAEGAGYTWAANSRDYQITPWTNDPVTNRPVEGFFLRDRQTGRVATPFAALSDDPAAIYEARHSLGRSEFRAWTDWLEVTAVQTLAAHGPAKLTRLTLRNLTSRPLTLDCAAFGELVLGNDPARTSAMIRIGFDKVLQAVVARNAYSTDFAGRLTALGADRPITGHLTTRRDFFGLTGQSHRPKALTSIWPEIPATVTAPGDPCAVILAQMELAPGQTGQITFALVNALEPDIQTVLKTALAPDSTSTALTAAAKEWDHFLGALQVTTPDPKLDLLVNTWLPYQALTCRIRARSAFYQASGAFGFRDQLQDTAAFLLQDPSLARDQILQAASRQFIEGDVQHWWLPATGAGVRTTISDDVVWLGHITAHYIKVTGDIGLLDQPVAFLQGPMLEPHQHDAFFQPAEAEKTAPLYDHCAIALDLAIRRTGPHGLPLMLGGDWNDGMNRVGEGGQGESIWLGWFLAATLDAFVPLAQARGDTDRANGWLAHRAALGEALERDGWDGAWFRRGYYDDGTPLGSASSQECRIDSIAQSWAVISGVASPERGHMAMDSALAHLADPQAQILRLFTPPFEHTAMQPGYIKGYPPGVRENGGQYTHAAAWMVYALGRMGRGDDAVRMLNLINPINHALTREAADLYRVEPYVVAADVYGAGDKAGRGGWTWYTGSAGWVYRAIVESILGITVEGGTHLKLAPALPQDWPGYSATLRHNDRTYQIAVTREYGVLRLTVNGNAPDQQGRFPLDVP